MKKSLMLMASTAFMLAAVSCSSDDMPGADIGDGNASFTVTLPGEEFVSRAFADGKSATKLDYAVYDASNNALITSGNAEFVSTSLSTKVSIPLANGKSYKIAFFAHDNSDVYTFDAATHSFSVDYTKMTDYNSTDYDSFFKLYETGVVTGAISKTVTLTRPVAQLNWGTSDIDAATVTAADMYGENASLLKTKVTIKGVYGGYDMFTGEVTGDPVDVEFPLAARPSGQDFPYEPTTYKYLSMSYLLVPADQGLVEAVLTPNNGTVDYEATTVTNLPVQANYRTNIYGSLLTTPANFTITKDKKFSGSHDYNKEYTQAYNASQVTSAISSGKTVQLQNDVTITTSISINIGKSPEICLNGHTLTINKTPAKIISNKSLTIDGSTSAGGNSKLVFGEGVSTGFELNGTGALTLKNVDMEYAYPTGSKVGSAVFVNGSTAKLNMSNVTITVNSLAYAITMNASKTYKPVINLDNVKVYSYGGINCPILLNQPCTLTATNCHFEGCTNAIILRGGNYTFTNCEFVQTLLKNKTEKYEDRAKVAEFRLRNRTADWGQGTDVPYACVTMGNRGADAYQYPTDVTMNGCKIMVADGAKNVGNIDESLPAVYIYANQGNGLGVNFNYDSATTITGDVEVASANVVINGTSAPVTP